MRHFFALALALSVVTGQGQSIATFENFNLPAGAFLNNAAEGSFAVANISLPNDYNQDYDAWQGWAISAATDTATPGFSNQYSAITGSGVNGSTTYAVTYAIDRAIIRTENEAAGGFVEGLYITNSTYAYRSMLDGDSFAKKFGGETGEDPDYFLLTIKAYYQGQLSTDSIDLYLADYRFADPADDYILDEWTFVDLTMLGNTDSLSFLLSSTDTGQFGMNTPAFFCVDNVTTADRPVRAHEEMEKSAVRIAPNPVIANIQLHWPLETAGNAKLYDLQGRSLLSFPVRPGDNEIDLSDLPPGAYMLRYQSPAGWETRKLVKI